MPGLLCCTWEQFVLMVSPEWTAAIEVCNAMQQEVAGAVTLCSFSQVWYRPYTISLINRAILKIGNVDLSGEEFYYHCWHNHVHMMFSFDSEPQRNHHRYRCCTLIHFNNYKNYKFMHKKYTTLSFNITPHLSKHPAWVNEEQAKGWNGCLSWDRYIFMTLSAQTLTEAQVPSC